MFNKRFIALFTALSLLAAFASLFPFTAVAETRQPITLTVTSAEGERGELAEVRVNISDNKGLNGMQFRLKYDPTMLEALESTAEEEYTYANQLNDFSTVNFGEGYVDFFATDLTAYKSNKSIAVVTFRLLKTGESAVEIEVDKARGDCFYYLDGADMIDLDYVLVPGTVTTHFSLQNDFYYRLDAPGTTLYGEQAHVTLSMHNLPADIYGFSVEVNFDPEKLAFVSGAFSPTFPYGRAVLSAPGKARVFSATDVKKPAAGDAVMAELIFDIIDPAPVDGGAYELTISFYNSQPGYTLDEDRNTVHITDVCTVGTAIRVTVPDAGFDPDGSGVVDISDVTALLDWLSGSRGSVADGVSTDLNGDGDTSIEDVTALLDALST